MAEIKRRDEQQPVIDYMARDYSSLLQAMRNQIPFKLPEWVDYESEADFGNVLLELFAHMGDILSYYQDRVANESFLSTAQDRRSIIHHLRLIGYDLSTAAPASTLLTLLVDPAQTGIVTIQTGYAFATKSQPDKPSSHFEYTRRVPVTINLADLPTCTKTETGSSFLYCGALPASYTADDPGAVTFPGIPVEEGWFVNDELLGTSDGTPNQSFPLAHPGLILRSIGQGNRDVILLTRLGDLIEEWTLREALAFSRANQRDFIIQIDADDRATVTFGDGAFGVIPPAGSEIYITYRRGGGTTGNVAPQTIETIVDAPPLVLIGAKVTNPTAATGGADREKIEYAVKHAPNVYRSQKRAVTAADYEALALDFQGVGKVRAEPGGWRNVELYIAPTGGGYASDVLRANLLAYFEDKRPVTTQIVIRDVDYVEIYVTATIVVKPYYDEEEIRVRVQTATNALLEFENVKFRDTLYLSKFYEAIEAIEGVASTTIIQFNRSGVSDEVKEDGKIVLGENEIPIPAHADGTQILIEVE